MPSTKLSIGIVGLPNVGKSTLFKTLTKKQVLIANYPFCTIDPNVGVVLVPDERVDKLAELSKSKKKIYATVDFVDIAGLVKGASTGEGLGNKFLANIREVDAVLYVLRAFKKSDIINTQNEVNPLKEKEILDVELILKDLETINRVLEKPAKSRGHLGGPATISPKASLGGEMAVLKKAKEFLSAEKVLIDQNFADDEKEILQSYQLLTFKPRLYLLNGSAEEIATSDVAKLGDVGRLVLDVAQEYESAEFSKEERIGLGLPEESGLDLLIKKSYELLNLITFLTTGEDETRAWTIKKGDTAPIAGAAIHTDFQNKFVKAEVVFWQDLLDAGGYPKAREQGKLRTEGKEYVVKDGDVIEFKHG